MEERQYLSRVRAFLEEKGWEYEYTEEDGLGSIDFSYRGVPYHIWEFEENRERGAETNLYHGGRQQEVLGDYEAELIREMKQWQTEERLTNRPPEPIIKKIMDERMTL